MIVNDLRLCLVTNILDQPFPCYKTFLLQAIEGGVTSVQLRSKMLNHVDFHALALSLKLFLSPLNIPLIINDHVDIAVTVDADGVHIGQSDCAPTDVREQLGRDKWIGLSVETLSDLERANALDCIDYIAASALFPTQTKTVCKTYWGLAGLQILVDHSRHPVVAIGGINKKNIKDVMHCGAAGVAVVNAIHDVPNPAQAARDLIHAMSGACHV